MNSDLNVQKCLKDCLKLLLLLNFEIIYNNEKPKVSLFHSSQMDSVPNHMKQAYQRAFLHCIKFKRFY